MDPFHIGCRTEPVQGRHQDPIRIQLLRGLARIQVLRPQALLHSLSKLQGPGVNNSSRLAGRSRCHAEDTGADESLQELEESERLNRNGCRYLLMIE